MFCECACGEKVSPTDHESDTKDEDEKDDGVRVEGEVVAGTIDASAIELVIFRVAIEGEARNCHESTEGCNQLDLVNSQIPLLLCACVDLPGDLPTNH